MSNGLRPDAVNGVQFIAIYVNLPTGQIPFLKRFIPPWLWRKRVENSAKTARAVAAKSEQLFKGEAVDMAFICEDLVSNGFRPTHVHMMSRETGQHRIRFLWERGSTLTPEEREEKKLGDGTQLPQNEILDMLHLLRRFIVDVVSYHNSATEHLPELISISCARPTERDQTTSVLSVQIVNGRIGLVVD